MPAKPAKPSAEPLWLLAVLQRDGRLVDFLLENLEGYDNEQIAGFFASEHRHRIGAPEL